MLSQPTEGKSMRRRAVVAVQVIVLMGVLLGFAALAVDVGAIYNTKADLQRSADAAALAGASALTTDLMMQVRQGTAGVSAYFELVGEINARSTAFSNLNTTFGQDATPIETSQIAKGWLDLTSPDSVLDTNASLNQFNAIQVTARRTDGSLNGSLALMFAGIFGDEKADITADATAAFDDRAVGIDISKLPNNMLPFSVHENVYDAAMAAGDDVYSYDAAMAAVSAGADGINEVNIYPHDIVPGNFGLLNIGAPNQGVPALADQIENGVDSADFISEVGTDVLTFLDSNNEPVTYTITGDTGLKSALEMSIESKIGKEVGFFVHTNTTGTGANSSYTVSNIRFGVLMDVQLQGAAADRGLWIQPTTHASTAVQLSASAPSSGGMLGRVVLVR